MHKHIGIEEITNEAMLNRSSEFIFFAVFEEVAYIPE